MKRSDEDLPIGNEAKKFKIEKGEENNAETVQTIEAAPIAEAPMVEAPMVEAPTEEAPMVEAPPEEALAEQALAEEALTEDPATVILGGSTQNVITQMMDIAEPMANLRTMLEQRLQCNLIEHEIYLQNSAQLDPAKSLLEQGVSAEGVVQFSVQVISTQGVKPRLNIVDIVKPIIETVEVPVETVEHDLLAAAGDASAKLQAEEQVEEVTRWVVCNNYRDEQEKFNIPFDPMEWEPHHTVHWLRWAATEFSLPLEVSVLNTMKMSGRVLCVLTKDDFVSRLPKPAGDLFWTHLDLLRKTVSEQESTIAEVKTAVPEVAESQTVTLGETPTIVIQTIKGPPTLAAHRSVPRPPRSPRITKCSSDDKVSPGNRTGNNGQIQLWQFLLELLTDKDSQDCISWVGENGEFKLNDPELTAQRWGARKNKPSMNYEKLSRALRYYYDGDMIAKVHGKRFVYKFVCDLQGLLGYNATELNKLVTDCRQKKIDRLRGGHISQVTILK